MAVQAERRVPLSRERVLEAAAALADEGGIEAVSMRRLGQALGVEAMSLYNHVASKNDLLAGMVELVMNQFELPTPDEDWEAGIWRLATSGHDALIRHPWACTLMMSIVSVNLSRIRYMEALMRCLREAGFSPEITYHAYHAIDSHILGFTFWQLGHVMPVSMPRVQTKEEMAVFMASIVPGLSMDTFPYLLEHGVQHMSEGSHKDMSTFDFGLKLIVDGLKRMRDTA